MTTLGANNHSDQDPRIMKISLCGMIRDKPSFCTQRLPSAHISSNNPVYNIPRVSATSLSIYGHAIVQIHHVPSSSAASSLSSYTDTPPVWEYYRVLSPSLRPHTRYLRRCHPRFATVNYAYSKRERAGSAAWRLASYNVLARRRCRNKPRGIIKQPAYGGVISRKLSARGHARWWDEIRPTLSPGSKSAVYAPLGSSLA